MVPRGVETYDLLPPTRVLFDHGHNISYCSDRQCSETLCIFLNVPLRNFYITFLLMALIFCCYLSLSLLPNTYLRKFGFPAVPGSLKPLRTDESGVLARTASPSLVSFNLSPSSHD